MLLGTQDARGQELLQGRRAWGFVPLSKGSQGGHADRAAGLEPELQIAAIQQGIEALHGNGQQQQGGRGAWGQGPAFRQVQIALAQEQFCGDPTTRTGVGGAVLAHPLRQRQEGRLGLAAIGGLGEGGGAAQEAQLNRLIAPRLGYHREPDGGVRLLGGARVDVVAEEVEAPVEGHVQVAAPPKCGEQDPRPADEFGVVVVQHQHPIEASRQRADLLRAQHRGGGGAGGEEDRKHGRSP